MKSPEVVTWYYGTASGVVFDKPCQLVAIYCNVSVDGKGLIAYDAGIAETSGLRVHLTAFASETKTVPFNYRIPMYHGIYVVKDTQCSDFLIGYIPDIEGYYTR